jgi:hypothetical protein
LWIFKTLYFGQPMNKNNITLSLILGIMLIFGIKKCTASSQNTDQITFEFDQKNEVVFLANSAQLSVSTPADYEKAIRKFVELDQQGQISYAEGVNQRVACAERVSKILKIIDPSVYKVLTSKNLAEGVYNDLKKNNPNQVTTDLSKVGSLALTIYFDGYSNNQPSGIGHIGLLFRGKDGKLREFSNSSSFKTKVHESFEASTRWYSGTYAKSAVLPIK